MGIPALSLSVVYFRMLEMKLNLSCLLWWHIH